VGQDFNWEAPESGFRCKSLVQDHGLYNLVMLFDKLLVEIFSTTIPRSEISCKTASNCCWRSVTMTLMPRSLPDDRVVGIEESGVWGFKVWNLVIVNMASDVQDIVYMRSYIVRQLPMPLVIILRDPCL